MKTIFKMLYKSRKKPMMTDEQRRRAARDRAEYSNFLSYDGSEQPEIDESTLL